MRILPAGGDTVAAARNDMHAGRADLAVAVLEPFVAAASGDADAWQLLGFAYREEQRMREAVEAFARAVDLDPQCAKSALAYAQARFEFGLPAVEFARRALELAPDNPASIGNCATVLAGEGQPRAAENLLVEALARRPDWLEGQRTLANLRWTGGDNREFARGYAAACRALPHHLPLRLAWFRTVAQARDWEAAGQIVDEGERLLGANRAFTVARLFVAAESGDQARAEKLFANTAQLRDEVRDLAFVRYSLRHGRPEAAQAIAEELIGTPSTLQVWPYLSLIWRLRNDGRAQWLDQPAALICAMDLQIAPDELATLATLLRGLHTARSPYLEQSVRGGTQTDRPLFYRHEPVIQALKTKIVTAVHKYIGTLPSPDPAHPLLGAPRGEVRFSGSWSVRLQPQGYHVSHTHPQGWISSAFYVALPATSQLGAAPAGWISFGTAPREMGLDLPPYLRVEPRLGRLVLFPSTMWHATLPFQDGERMAIAFDVRTPRY
jgi:tetratricopeptide (TPR) repeat protein